MTVPIPSLKTSYNSNFLEHVGDRTMMPIVVFISLKCKPGYNSECSYAKQEKIHGSVEPFWIIIEDQDSEAVLHHEYFVLKRHLIDEDHSISFTVAINEPMPPQYFIKVPHCFLRTKSML